MDAQELRIGNIGYDVIKGRMVEIIGINSTWNDVWVRYKNKADYKIDINDFVGYELTEEWLLKFGFVHDCATPDINFWIDMITHYLELRDFRDEWYPTYCQLPEMPNERTQRCGMNAIKYAHQLQNLYFALTGTELTISEK